MPDRTTSLQATKLVPLTAEILLGPDLDVRTVRPECPADLAAFIARCAHVSVDERFASASPDGRYTNQRILEGVPQKQ